MDASLYKTLAVSRGLTYRYYCSPAQDGKPVVLLTHGFPSSSYDWHRLVAYLQPKGYGLLVPDQLGYGGTDKPLDAAEYRARLLVRDMVDILDAENVQKAFVVGHDWGVKVASRLANYHPDRFYGFGFLAVGYVAPSPSYDFEAVNAVIKQALGRETFGYWYLFTEDGAETLIDDNKEKFMNIVYPENAEVWLEHFAGKGQLQQALQGKQDFKPAPYLSEEERSHILASLKAQSIKAPLNWYKVYKSGMDAEDDKALSEASYGIGKPVFFGAATKDYVCVPALQTPGVAKFCPHATTKEYDGDHWIILSHAEQIGADLQEWIDKAYAAAQTQA